MILSIKHTTITTPHDYRNRRRQTLLYEQRKAESTRISQHSNVQHSTTYHFGDGSGQAVHHS